ncbi:hypothetical protein K470DRAFT_114245 [Piedraia hortae CBS 480.64]|uniref:Uncharacterized protein n=1 Tax=Piedraia hortae CBS 480.64 TaxID=1314780 RepID=A0A6A7BUR2_9PEZI|nr:hypothetical protein K470DRAFT_114245 [Piedraia hortae CBS 480.64]
MGSSIAHAVEHDVPFVNWHHQALASLLKDMSQVYDSVDMKKTAKANLSNLRMGPDQPWPEFFAKITEYHSELSYDTTAKVSQLRPRINKRLQDAISYQANTPPDDDYKGWACLYAKLDDSTRRAEKAKGLSGFLPDTQEVAMPASDPMEINNLNAVLQCTDDLQVSQAQYNYRRANYLSFGCRSAEHRWRRCPNRQKPRGSDRASRGGRGDAQ